MINGNTSGLKEYILENLKLNIFIIKFYNDLYYK